MPLVLNNATIVTLTNATGVMLNNTTDVFSFVGVISPPSAMIVISPPSAMMVISPPSAMMVISPPSYKGDGYMLHDAILSYIFWGHSIIYLCLLDAIRYQFTVWPVFSVNCHILNFSLFMCALNFCIFQFRRLWKYILLTLECAL